MPGSNVSDCTLPFQSSKISCHGRDQSKFEGVAQLPHIEICDKQRLIDVGPFDEQYGVHSQKAPQESHFHFHFRPSESETTVL